MDSITTILTTKFHLDPSTLKPESKFVEDLKMDSLDLVALLTACEDHYNIRISAEDSKNIFTLKDLYKAFDKKPSLQLTSE